MRLRSLTIVILFLLPVLPALGQEADAPADTLAPSQVLLLGPLPTPPPAQEADFPRGTPRDVLEITPAKALPDASVKLSPAPGTALRWTTTKCDELGAVAAPEPGIYWVTAVLRVPQRAETTLLLTGGKSLFLDGEELTGSSEDDVLSASKTLRAGWYTVQGRCEGAPALSVVTEAGVAPSWTLSPTAALTDFEFLAGLPRVSQLAISDDGRLILRRLSRREPALGRLDVLDADGKLLASDLGGGRCTPIAFFPGSHDLLLTRHDADGTELLVWSGPAGPLRTILRDEPDLGFVRISPDGRFLLFSSTAGLEKAGAETGNRRVVHLRGEVNDFTPAPHLHLLDVAGGTRRLLTTPGDLVLDDAVFAADGRRVLYARTTPQLERPWFRSEIRELDLATGADDLLAEFTGGWEVRPQGLAASPDGRTLAFLGPPDQVGGDRAEHNVYNKQVWTLDLGTGRTRRVSGDEPRSYDVGGGLPRFDARGRLLVQATDGSRQTLARLDPKRDWEVEEIALEGGSLEALAVGPDGDRVVYSASGSDAPGALYRGRTSGSSARIEDYAADWSRLWTWSRPEPAVATAGDGTRIDGWLYPPLRADSQGQPVCGVPEDGRCPLIVYYYAGSSPTLQGFNGTHQFFAANGYAVLVVNPRGAYGYGDRFADFHAGDWGPAAAADIVAATEQTLAAHAWLDPDAVGIYGGSYGGFMTEYLVSYTDIYAAAVSMYGISDLATYWGQGAWGWTYGDMALGGRAPWSDPQYFIEHSPLFRADRIHTPLLLLHGQSDTNVTPGESRQLFTALSLLDRPVEMVLFPGEEHGISGSWENRVAHRTMMLEWFDRYLRGEDAAWKERWK